MSNWNVNPKTPLEQHLAEYIRWRATTENSEHIELDELIRLARARRRRRKDFELLNHILDCPECREMYSHLEAIHQKLATRRVRWMPRPLYVWAGAVVAVILLVVGLFWRGLNGEEAIVQEPRVSFPQPEPRFSTPERFADTPPNLIDEYRPALPEPPRSPLAMELVSLPRVESFVRKAAESLATLTPDDNARSEPERVLPLRFLTPDIESNAAIEETQPTFSWSPVEGAVGYRIQLRSAENQQLWIEAELGAKQTRFAVPAHKALQRGAEYEVYLTANLESGQTLTVGWRFLILSRQQLPAMRWARANAGRYPLLSAAVFFYDLDRYTEAQACLQYARQRYPQDTQIPKWIEAVQQRITLRQREFTAEPPS